MSLDTWIEEFYPITAKEVDPEQAIAHSLQKWQGLTAESLARHDVEIHDRQVVDRGTKSGMFIGSSNCALCRLYSDEDEKFEMDEYACQRCPLAQVRGGVPCDQSQEDELSSGSPWINWASSQNPEPMIHWLQLTAKRFQPET